MSTHDDGDLRRLFDDAVSEVHPYDGVEQIRDRARRPAASRWVPVTLAAAAAVAVVIAGGAWLAGQQPGSDPPAAAPAPTDETSDPPASPTPAGRDVDATVYVVTQTAAGPRLTPEVRRIADATGSDLQVAIDAALAGAPGDSAEGTAWPVAGTTAAASIQGQLIVIDLDIPSVGWAEAAGVVQHAVQSLVWTADEAAGRDLPVRFLVSGQPTEQLLGVDVSQPVQKASADSVLSPVIIDSPAEGATVPSRFTVTGRAATFEANVVWELKRGQDTVRSGFTTAQVCCTLSPYSFEVTAPPGDYTLVVHDTDESDGEGVGVTQVTRAVRVE